ncbi:MAG: alginate lyase family protein [Calditrichaceae bacterium]|nr:alginate lyase family protein [Calditrichia bacterium]NUQ41766.1 alginate lyase family protein [Calditrichaceae bacterium]
MFRSKSNLFRWLIVLLAMLVGAEIFAQTGSIWTSAAELAQLPMSGAAWDKMKAEADKPTGTPNLSNQDDPTNVRVLAKALVYARTGVQSYRTEVIDACMAAIGTEEGGRTLALGRELIAYVIAADLVGLPANENAIFRSWLQEVRHKDLQGRTLISTHEDRPNNWGTHCGGSRVAVAVYLNDTQEIASCAQVFKGYLGDRQSYAGFEYGDLDWQVDPGQPVGVNPLGATKQGHSIDGVLPDDQRRAGGFNWPPPKENYVYEALQGALAQAVILYRAGYTDVWNWEDQALLRGFKWLHEQANYTATGDDTWQPHLVNFYYGSNFPAPVPSSPGKNVGWTDWSHSGVNTGNTAPSTPGNLRVEK